MRARILASFCAMVAFCFPEGVRAEGEWIAAPEMDALLFDGTIGHDAAQQFSLMLIRNPDTKVVAFNSPGGYVVPALEIAEKIHGQGINTVIMEDNVCFSACAIMFMAGSTRYAVGELGVHQISGTDDISVTQQTVAQIYDSLLTFGTDQKFLNLMFETASEDMYIFTAEEIETLSINRAAGTPPMLENDPSSSGVDFDTVASSQHGSWEALLLRNRDNGHYLCALQSVEDKPLIRIVNYLTKRDAFVEILNIPLPMQTGAERLYLDFQSLNKEPIGMSAIATVENPQTAWFNIESEDTGQMFIALIALYRQMKLESEDGRILGMYDLSGSLKSAQAFSRCSLYTM